MFKFLRRYGWRFLTSRTYRSYVFQLLRERSAPTESPDAFPLSAHNDFSDLRGSKVFLCGGCELTFIGDHFKSVGLDVYHTFENGRTAEPMIEVTSTDSELFATPFQAVVFCQAQSFMQITKKMLAAGTAYAEDEKQRDFETLLSHLRVAIDRVSGAMECPIFLVSHFFIHVRYRGAHEFKTHGASTSYEEMNQRYTAALYEIAKSHKNVYVLDVNRILEIEGKKRTLEYDIRSGIFDHPTKFGARLIAEDALYQLQTLNPKSKRVKCAVFDLDNTLWTGVLREDGVANLYPKWGHLNVMQSLAARGILLAVCSKNDPEEEPLVEQMLGSELFNQLVSVKLNWNPKSASIKQIALELNIGVDAIAFFDDNPLERAEVAANAPGVVVFDDKHIMAAPDMVMFEPIGVVTAESAARTQMYKEQAKRAAAESSVDPANVAEFYKSCQFQLDIRRPDAAMTARIEELIQRTNQLNATGNRTTQAELQRYLADEARYYVAAASLKDKFGDYGLIGVCIAEHGTSSWDIREFDFSCRAMGKHVEHALLTHLARAVSEAGGDTITMRFQKTARNKEMRSILRNFGFVVTEETDETAQFRLVVDRDRFAYPEWLAVVEGPAAAK
jgi:FkbH-like protein